MPVPTESISYTARSFFRTSASASASAPSSSKCAWWWWACDGRRLPWPEPAAVDRRRGSAALLPLLDGSAVWLLRETELRRDAGTGTAGAFSTSFKRSKRCSHLSSTLFLRLSWSLTVSRADSAMTRTERSAVERCVVAMMRETARLLGRAMRKPETAVFLV